MKSVFPTRGRRASNGRLDVAALRRHEALTLVQRLYGGSRAESRRALLFAGVEDDLGSAHVCGEVGEILASQDARSVCVLDAHLRSPSLHQDFDLPDGPVPSAPVQQSEVGPLVVRQVRPANLWVLSPGSPACDAALLQNAQRLRGLVRDLCTRFDHVLIAGPPITRYAESLALSQIVDGVVLVVEAHVTRRETVRTVKSTLEAVKAPLLGIVLNNRTFPIPDSVYRRL